MQAQFWVLSFGGLKLENEYFSQSGQKQKGRMKKIASKLMGLLFPVADLGGRPRSPPQ